MACFTAACSLHPLPARDLLLCSTPNPQSSHFPALPCTSNPDTNASDQAPFWKKGKEISEGGKRGACRAPRYALVPRFCLRVNPRGEAARKLGTRVCLVANAALFLHFPPSSCNSTQSMNESWAAQSSGAACQHKALHTGIQRARQLPVVWAEKWAPQLQSTQSTGLHHSCMLGIMQAQRLHLS